MILLTLGLAFFGGLIIGVRGGLWLILLGSATAFLSGLAAGLFQDLGWGRSLLAALAALFLCQIGYLASLALTMIWHHANDSHRLAERIRSELLRPRFWRRNDRHG